MTFRTLNIVANSPDPALQKLSNFSHSPFTLDGVQCASMEGLGMHLMLPPGDPNRELALTLSGKEAKKLGANAERNFVWWLGRQMPFRSPAHEALLERGSRAKFEQNPEHMAALLSTAGAWLTHDTGKPERPDTSYPAHVYMDVLTRQRDGRLPRWPYGTLAEPLEVRVSKPEDGTQFQARIVEPGPHGYSYWLRYGFSAQAAVAELLTPLMCAHTELRFHIVLE